MLTGSWRGRSPLRALKEVLFADGACGNIQADSTVEMIHLEIGIWRSMGMSLNRPLSEKLTPGM
jgi:hypothetical protein